MAKQTHKLRENIRNMTLRMDYMEVKQVETDKRLVALATIIRRNGLEDLIADVPQSAASIGRANLALDQHFDAIPGTLQPVVEIEQAEVKPISNRNTPEKKKHKKALCSVLVIARAECDIPVDDLTTHRAELKERNHNWQTIERAAETVIIEDNSKQDLPLIKTIFCYTRRLRLKVLEKAQSEQVKSIGSDKAKLYKSRSRTALYNGRADGLLALLQDMMKTYGSKRCDVAPDRY